MVSKRAKCNKESGRKGGLATARNHDSDFLEARSSKAGTATRDKYGIEYYRYLSKLRPAGTRSASVRVAKLIKQVIPTKKTLDPANTVQLMQYAAKSISNV